MKTLGYALIAAGFLAGSLFAAETPQDEDEVNWGRFVPAVVIAAIGVALARFGAVSETREEGTVVARVETLTASIDRIANSARLLDEQKGELNPYEFHGRVDELFVEDLATFAEARESIAHRFGLQPYADVMNEFAAGERYIHRVWSASVDGYIDEVLAYVPRAREQFEKTRDKLEALTRASS